MSSTFLVSGAVLAQLVLADTVLDTRTAREAVPLASSTPAADTARRSIRMRWLADLGAESLVASPRPVVGGGGPVAVSVPGAAYVFAVYPDGSLRERKRLALDPSAPYGLAVTESGVALASKEGSLSLWSFPSSGEVSLRWRRELGERATSVGW